MTAAAVAFVLGSLTGSLVKDGWTVQSVDVEAATIDLDPPTVLDDAGLVSVVLEVRTLDTRS